MKYKGLSNSGFHAVWMFNMSESFLRCSSLHACVSAWAEYGAVEKQRDLLNTDIMRQNFGIQCMCSKTKNIPINSIAF